MFSIVIPTYNHYDLLHNRLTELGFMNDVEVIVVDDCSPEEEEIKGGIGWFQTWYNPSLRYIRNPENLGFPKTCNVGIKSAKGDYVAVLSTDVKVLSSGFAQDTIKMLEESKCFVGGRLITFYTGWNKFSFSEIPVSYLEGWYIAAKKKDWHKVKGFDEKIYRFDGEDIDLSLTLGRMGYDLKALPDGNFFHTSGVSIASLGIDREAITRQNLKYIDEKWSAIDGTK